MIIPTRPSGPSATPVSALALGSWNTWDRTPPETVAETLRLAVDAGVTLFDLAVYGAEPDEMPDDATDVVFARAMRAAGIGRERYRIAAKGWLPAPGRPVPPLARQLDALLRRQGAEHADFLVLGDLMEARADHGELLDEVDALIGAGKVLGWAVNNWSAAEIGALVGQADAAGMPRPDYAQLKYGLTRRSIPEGEPFAELCRRTGLTIQASDVFEGGLVFGPSGRSRIIGGDIGGTQERIRAAAGRMREVAAGLGATVAQLSIALPLTNPHTSSVLIGSRTPEQTRDNLGAFALLERHTAEEIRAAAAEFWFDRETVSPDAAWGASPGDDPAGYVVVEREPGAAA